MSNVKTLHKTKVKDSNVIVLLVAELVVVTVALEHVLKKIFIS